MGTIIEAVRGMRDVLPREYEQQTAIAEILNRVLTSYGYRWIDLPVVERRDLYLRKLGEELVGKVYEFTFNGRDLALRPEWTASVLRAYVSRMQDQPLPLRLCYAGPVFRNERPQRATYRQFTQIGVELIGGPAPRADAECIALACRGLDEVGVISYQVRVGHVGFIRHVLTELHLAERTQGFLVWSLERMRSQGADSIRSQLDLEEENLPFDAALLDGIEDAQAEALLQHALESIGVNLRFGTRPPEAIVQRLVRKLHRRDPEANIERAMDLLEQLSALHGSPTTIFPMAERLLQSFDLPVSGLDELRTIIGLVQAHGVAEDRIIVDFGLGRGLHYYTGLIFEMYADDGLQLCGGGRYDDLVAAFGGRQSVPAVGFAYGLERVITAVQEPPTVARSQEALVVVGDDESYGSALHIADELRACGVIVTIDVRNRSLASNVRDATRREIAFIAMVDKTWNETRKVLWRNVVTHEEFSVSVSDFVEHTLHYATQA
ncbi:MAG: ATP phosphoribosyltransferase regulatory subunit [Chloroflexi bacterium AL-W]|nr:ATP phosphoribosyltransferase regulatory subunit [Chloroflexi bacterium AL-N1]NOK70621.1 ATP phosphoribosyltransferase regulatory subunit [Chloroflexi bacterium AL-N10]NOK77613.1 ATP phosphoribosyltransferase regulatory subunit [Chloroflexi bacterium AL-N5]NOK84464.1 ATP phosphoribosyltransferase regulatory subunit [Chloroflexi bacterium AL-W]NOK92353.1 ATP phosphoribosyltransferase regulatory subunit [Chloroflexi bacterium AL-N15]